MPIGFGLLNFNRHAGSAPSWDPTSLPSLALWLQTSKLSNGPVASYPDQGGASHAFTQATAGQRPVKSAAPDLVTFDGADDLLGNPDDVLGGGAASIGFKFKLNALPGASSFMCPVGLFGFGAGRFEILLMNLGGYQNLTFSMLNMLASASGIAVTLDTSAHTLIVTASAVDGSYTAYLDGVAQSVIASGAVNPGFSTSAIGARPDGGSPLNGALGDIVATKAVIGATDAAKLHTYLLSA